MANSDENFDSAFNDPLPPEFIRWSLGLDFDDDEEFRAGYPFTDVPEIEPNENWQAHDSLSTSDHDVYELNNSDDVDGYISTTTSSFEQQEKEDVQLESYLTNEDCVNQSMNSNELYNNIEEEKNSDHEDDCVDQEKKININKFEPLNQIEENKEVAKNSM